MRFKFSFFWIGVIFLVSAFILKTSFEAVFFIVGIMFIFYGFAKDVVKHIKQKEQHIDLSVKNKKTLSLNIFVFNLVFILFSIISFLLFMAGTGGWIGFFEFGCFALLFLVLICFSFAQIIMACLAKRTKIRVIKKTFYLFIFSIVFLGIFLTLFNFGDCGDAGIGTYTLITKISAAEGGNIFGYIFNMDICNALKKDFSLASRSAGIMPLIVFGFPIFFILLFSFFSYINSRQSI